jgi:hypothetical protein
MTYDQENFMVHPSNNAFSYHNLETACYYWDYVIAYEYFLPKLILFICSTQISMIILFLPNSDLKYSYVFPLMTNVVLTISHKKCYWAYSSYKDLLLRWAIIQ